MSSIQVSNLSFLNSKSEHTLSLHMMYAFLVTFTFLVILSIDNMWIYIISLILSEILILRNSGLRYKNKFPAIFLLLFGIGIILDSAYLYVIIILAGLIFMSGSDMAPLFLAIAGTIVFLLENFLPKTKEREKVTCVENYYTLFTPFEKKVTINPTALSNDIFGYRTKEIIFGYDHPKFPIKLSKLILSRARVSNIRLKKVEDPYQSLINQEITMALIPSPLTKNLTCIGNVAHQHLFCITSIKAGLQYFTQIRNLGLPERLQHIWRDLGKYFQCKITIKDELELFKDLQDGKLDSVLYADVHPNRYINSILARGEGYQLLPILFPEEDAFIKENPYYRKSILPLTYDYVPSSYLPNGLGRIWKSDYTADYWTISYELTLACNKIEDEVGYDIAKTIYTSRKLLARNGMKSYIGDPFPPIEIIPLSNIQEGSKKFYEEKGLLKTF